MKKQYNIAEFAIVFIVAALVTVVVLPGLIFNPDKLLLIGNDDAYKNYFTYLYQTQYGSGVWFTGMNYPYGEHLLFADAQPLLVLFMNWLKGWVGPLVVFHWAIAAGFYLSIIYLHKILKRFGLPIVWSLCFAVLITLLSPQIFKMGGHYSLAYLCVLPIVFYYHLAYHQTAEKKYVVYLAIAAIIFVWLHLYLAAMIALWMAAYSFVYLFAGEGSVVQRLRFLWPLWLVALLPILLLKRVLIFSDPVTDRPEYPYGILENRTFIEDIYSSSVSPIWQWLKNNAVVSNISKGTETVAYIGLAAIVILLVALLVRVVHIKSKKLSLKEPLFIWLFMAIAILLFSTAFMFVNCFSCMDNAWVIKQFRAIGRFSWCYYYIATVAAVVLLYKGYKYLLETKKLLANTIMLLVLLVWLVEANGNLSWYRKLAADSGRMYRAFVEQATWQQRLNNAGYESDDFQGILMMPYIHIGSEKIGPNGSKLGLMKYAFQASLQLGLPIVDVMMSRSGWQQAFGQARIAGGVYAEKPLLRDVPDERPLLLMHYKNIQLNKDEQHLYTASKYIGTIHDNECYAFYPKQLLEIEQDVKDSIKQIAAIMSAQDSCLADSGMWYVEHFDEGTANDILFGSGAAAPIENFTKVVFDELLTPKYDGQLYEFSAWTKVPEHNFKIARFAVDCINDKDEIIAHYQPLVQEATDNYDYWMRANQFFLIPANCSRVRVKIINVIYPAYDALDELMVRPIGATILSRDANGKVMANNHLLR